MAATKQCGRGLRGRSPPGAGLGGSLRGGKRGKVTFGELTEICRFFCDPDCGGEVSGADRFDGGLTGMFCDRSRGRRRRGHR